MKYSVKLLPAVRNDLKNAKKWYNDQKTDLGEEYKTEINREINYLSNSPLLYQCKYKDLRQSLVRKFPFSIFYSVEEDKKQIVIFGILHNSRNPQIVSERRK